MPPLLWPMHIEFCMQDIAKQGSYASIGEPLETPLRFLNMGGKLRLKNLVAQSVFNDLFK